MKNIRKELQESEDEHEDGYQLKTNDELLRMVSDFGNGETEFHTVDLERLIIEHNQMKKSLSEIIHAQYSTDSSLADLNSYVRQGRELLSGMLDPDEFHPKCFPLNIIAPKESK